MSEHGGEKHLVQEPDAVNTKSVLTVGTASLLLFAVSIAITYVLMVRKDVELMGDKALYPEVPKEVGQPEVGIVNQWLFSIDKRHHELEARQDHRLRTAGWADAEKKRAHIPIEQAMEIVVTRSREGQPLTVPGGLKLPPALKPGEPPRPIQLPQQVAPTLPGGGAGKPPAAPGEGAPSPSPAPAGVDGGPIGVPGGDQPPAGAAPSGPAAPTGAAAPQGAAQPGGSAAPEGGAKPGGAAAAGAPAGANPGEHSTRTGGSTTAPSTHSPQQD